MTTDEMTRATASLAEARASRRAAINMKNMELTFVAEAMVAEAAALEVVADNAAVLGA